MGLVMGWRAEVVRAVALQAMVEQMAEGVGAAVCLKEREGALEAVEATAGAELEAVEQVVVVRAVEMMAVVG